MLTHDDILLPLAMTVIVDNKVRDPELLEFRRQAAALITLFDLPEVSESDLKDWFSNHEEQIDKTLHSRSKNTAILRALTRFKETPHMEAMYDAMVTISVCDKEYDLEESKLIKSAGMIWGFQRPPIKIDR